MLAGSHSTGQALQKDHSCALDAPHPSPSHPPLLMPLADSFLVHPVSRAYQHSHKHTRHSISMHCRQWQVQAPATAAQTFRNLLKVSASMSPAPPSSDTACLGQGYRQGTGVSDARTAHKFLQGYHMLMFATVRCSCHSDRVLPWQCRTTREKHGNHS